MATNKKAEPVQPAADPHRYVVKYDGSKPPKSLKDWCDRNPHKVEELNCGNGYSGNRGGFAYDVMLRDGWSKSDDCVHTIIEYTVADMLRELRALTPCDCGQCLAGIAKRDAAIKAGSNGAKAGGTP